MSRIGKFTCSFSLDSVLVDPTFGPAVQLFSDAVELEVEIECQIDCDYDIEAEIESATLFGMPLSEEAIDALDLAAHAACVFDESGAVPPERGTVWRDRHGIDWIVLAVARPKGQATGDQVSLGRLGHHSYQQQFDLSGDRAKSRTGLLVPVYELVGCFVEDGELAWRRVLYEDNPGESEWRDPSVVYAGKRQGR